MGQGLYLAIRKPGLTCLPILGCLLFSCFVVMCSAANAAPYAYVPDLSGHHRIIVIDTATNSTIAEIPIGAGPHYPAINKSGTRLYVPIAGENYVAVIDTSSYMAIANIPVGTYPYDVALDPSESLLYVTNPASNSISVIDTGINEVIDTIHTASSDSPLMCAVNSSGTYLYVTYQDSGVLAIYDTNSNQEIKRIKVGDGPYQVAINNCGSKVYVANELSNSISVIDISTYAVTNTINLSEPVAHIAFSSDGGQIYAAGLAGSMFVIDTCTDQLVLAVQIGGYLGKLSTDIKTSLIYVPVCDQNMVKILDASNYQIVGTIVVSDNWPTTNWPFDIVSPRKTKLCQSCDAIPPTLSPVADKSVLWPPNHKLVDVIIKTNARDNSGLIPSLSAVVSSNEPQGGLGDGDIALDWTEPIINQATGTITLKLRAERAGSGTGREYTIAVTATDYAGNSASANVQIVVPHDKGKM